jgi:hypothetical protein
MLLTKHPVAVTAAGLGAVGVGSLANAMFPHKPLEDRVSADMTVIAGTVTAITGGVISVFAAQRARGRIFGGCVAASGIVVSLVFLAAIGGTEYLG